MEFSGNLAGRPKDRLDYLCADFMFRMSSFLILIFRCNQNEALLLVIWCVKQYFIQTVLQK
jgi:hypothetical protein